MNKTTNNMTFGGIDDLKKTILSQNTPTKKGLNPLQSTLMNSQGLRSSLVTEKRQTESDIGLMS